MRKPEEQPEPRKVRREGAPGGHAEVVFDVERRQFFYLDTLGERRWIGIPAGFAFDEHGQPQPVRADAPPE
ncbi:MAG: hypothetical protein Q7R40_14205 [Phaeospirillum sp.]|nr:hypothetical protein [Phaeospirillum sp.]